MTPLWGTKHSSALAGDKSGGDSRAARSPLSCALWRGMGGYGAAWAAWAAPSRCPRTVRTGNSAFRVFTKHETRDTNHGFFSNHSSPAHDFPPFPTISRHFPAFPGPPHPPPPIKCPRAVRLSWSAVRDCRPRPVAAFLRIVALHGAAMARHGRPAVPRSGNTACRFSPATRHATCFFPVPPATPRRATPSPANRFSRITKHETRNTAFILPYPPFPTISRHFPLFLGGWGVLRNRCSSAVSGKIPQKCTKSRIRGRLHGVYRQPRLPPPSGILGLRPTPNNPMLRKENILYRVEQCAYDRFFFYSGDRDEPRRVHVARDDRAAKFWLDPARMHKNGGLRHSEILGVQQTIELDCRMRRTTMNCRTRGTTQVDGYGTET